MPTSTSRSTRRLRPAAGTALVRCTWLLLCWALLAGHAYAQAGTPGWVFTPGITVGQVWDNNVTLSTEKGQQFGESASDFLTIITPRASLGFRGRWTDFSVNYAGSYEMYSQLSELNAYDQRMASSFRQVLSRHVSFVSRNSLSRSPSTDAINVPGVFFRRQGVVMDEYRGGLESRLDQRTTLNTLYTFEWLKYDDDSSVSPALQDLERGGYAHGAIVKLDHVLDSRWTVGSEYEMRLATVHNARDFNVQTAMGTATYQLDQRFTLSGGLGYAWLATADTNSTQSAPTFRINLDRSGESLRWHVGYRRSFIPSFGFGGRFSNQEFQAGFETPLARRWEWQGNAAVLQADPLNGVGPSLRSTWARTSVAYLANRWMRIEGYYSGAFQETEVAPNHVSRARVGVQVAAATRTRIR